MSTNNHSTGTRYPYYIKVAFILLGLIAFFYILKLIGGVLVPLCMATMLAILLNPVYKKMGKYMPKGLAISLSLLLAIIVTVGVLLFISQEVVTLTDTLPALKVKLLAIADDIQKWIYHKFSIDTDNQLEWLKNAIQNSSFSVGQQINSLFEVVSILVLIPIYVYLLLYYKTLILDFIFRIFKDEYSDRVAEILTETKSAIQSYVMGLLIEMIIVSSLNSIALLLLGVRSAILIGIIGGFLNVIPYLGGIIAISIPVLMATVTNDGYTTQLLIIAAYMVIQFIDNNILVPMIVSSKVQINALISIVIVLLGGQLWDFSGMFLSIPFIAVLKIIFDRIDHLKPWGSLLGTELPDSSSEIKWKLRLKKSKARQLEG